MKDQDRGRDYVPLEGKHVTEPHVFVGNGLRCRYCRADSDHPSHATHLVLMDDEGPAGARTPPTLDPDLIGAGEPDWTGRGD